MKNLFQVLLPVVVDKFFTYLGNETCKIGSVVLVEFGRKQIWGVIFDILPESSCEVATKKIKKIIEIHSSAKLSSSHLQFIKSLSAYNLAGRGLVLKSFIGTLNSDKTKKSIQKSPSVATEASLEYHTKNGFRLKQLSASQEKILDELLAKDGPIQRNEVALLDGATGSGKTEIYFALIAKILEPSILKFPALGTAEKPSLSAAFPESIELDENRSDSSLELQPQILILLPEIALTSQLLERFVEQFSFQPAIWHSKISKKAKREAFIGAIDGSLRVMIGARSALLLPFKNLKLVVIDEEHDGSFRQEEVFNFHARDMAILRGKIENFPVILSSATPSLETYHNVKIGKFRGFALDQQFGSKNAVEMVDMRKEKLASKRFLSSKLREMLAQNLEIRQQSLLFLNRRGYAPVSLCKACGQKYGCLSCDSYLVLHKSAKGNRLICHRCGHQELASPDCKFCKAKDSLISLGVGVEKILEEVKFLFPRAKIILVDSDNVSCFTDAQEFISKITNGEADIIIGTQMIAKGYDFANLSLVGIVDADSMLYSSDLRALERAFQIFIQVMGRSGRRQQEGKVLIQSFEPENLLFEQILKKTKRDFYEFELENRRRNEFPPFSQMARFEVSGASEDESRNFSKKLLSHFPNDSRIEIYGPAPAPVWKAKKRYNFWLHLKVPKNLNLQKLIVDVLASLEIPRSIRVKTIINP